MTFKNKNIKLDEESGILTFEIEMEPVKLAKHKKLCLFTQDVVDLLKPMGYDVQSVLQHASASNFRLPHKGEWKFLLKNFKKQIKIKKVEKQLEPTAESTQQADKNT